MPAGGGWPISFTLHLRLGFFAVVPSVVIDRERENHSYSTVATYIASSI